MAAVSVLTTAGLRISNLISNTLSRTQARQSTMADHMHWILNDTKVRPTYDLAVCPTYEACGSDTHRWSCTAALMPLPAPQEGRL
jgi:hypothetical protein